QFLTDAEWTTWKAKGCNSNSNTDTKLRMDCRWPFVRMSGQKTFQRSTLTANHGTYYIDTTVSASIQNSENFTKQSPRSVNVFKKDQTYYVFFLYAKTATKQTYQIFVGPPKTQQNQTGFNFIAKPGALDSSDLHAIRPTLNTMPPSEIKNDAW